MMFPPSDRIANEAKLLRNVCGQKQAIAKIGVSKAEFPAVWLQGNASGDGTGKLPSSCNVRLLHEKTEILVWCV
jgi:hypothetical protein